MMSYGINHVNVTVNYLKEQIEGHYAELRNGVLVRTFREPKFLGTIGSIKFVDTFNNDTILVMNSDLLTNIDYEDFSSTYRSTMQRCLLLLYLTMSASHTAFKVLMDARSGA